MEGRQAIVKNIAANAIENQFFFFSLPATRLTALFHWRPRA
jgi:hypothetical protein